MNKGLSKKNRQAQSASELNKGGKFVSDEDIIGRKESMNAGLHRSRPRSGQKQAKPNFLSDEDIVRAA